MPLGPPFGGALGAPLQNLAPAAPPAIGYRVISGAVWWRLVFWPWRMYLAARSVFIPATPPPLAPPGAAGVYFTDAPSLQGILSAPDFGRRVGLSLQDQLECQLHGCAVIQFAVPPGTQVLQATPYPGVQQGLTVGGAREWLATGNLILADTMLATYVDTTPGGPRYFQLPL